MTSHVLGVGGTQGRGKLSLPEEGGDGLWSPQEFRMSYILKREGILAKKKEQ